MQKYLTFISDLILVRTLTINSRVAVIKKSTNFCEF